MDDDQGGRTEESTRPDGIVEGSSDPPGATLGLDDVFTALGHPRRRYLLYTLVEKEDGVEESLSALAARIVAWEQNKAVDEVTADERRRAHVSLYHSHVPKLDDLGAVEFREGEECIVRAVNSEQVQAVLDGASGAVDSRQEIHARATDDE